jgi:hypothetical protein
MLVAPPTYAGSSIHQDDERFLSGEKFRETRRGEFVPDWDYAFPKQKKCEFCEDSLMPENLCRQMAVLNREDLTLPSVE